MSDMTFEAFLRIEEEREKHRRIKRMAEELTPAEPKRPPKKTAEDLKAEQRALTERIMNDAHRAYHERAKKAYSLAQPPIEPVDWLVFDRASGELYGEARALRAFQAFSEVNPMRRVVERRAGKDGAYALERYEPVAYTAVRCVQREEWQAAEAEFRKRKGANGHQK